MAIRFLNTSSEALTRTTQLLDHNVGYTIMFWARLVSDLGNYGFLWCFNVGGTHDGIRVNSDGTTLAIEAEGGVTGFVMDETGTNMTVGQWYHITLVRTLTVGTLNLYTNTWNGAMQTTPECTVTHNCTGRTATNRMDIGQLDAGDYMNWRVASCKTWQAALSPYEIYQESRYVAPVRKANLHAWYPLQRHADLNGGGPRRTSWTVVNTPETEDDPPFLQWSPDRRFRVWDVPAAAGGGGDPEGPLLRGKLLRGGLLLNGGVLVRC